MPCVSAGPRSSSSTSGCRAASWTACNCSEQIRREDPPIPVVMISGHGTIDTAVSAIKNGAYDFIEKPFKADRLLLVVDRAVEADRLRRENATLRRRAGGEVELRRIVGRRRQRSHPDRARCADGQPRADHRRVRRRQGDGRPADPQGLQAGRWACSSWSTARPCRQSGSRSSCSARTPRRTAIRCASRAPSSWLMAARCCSRKWPTCRCRCRASWRGCCRNNPIPATAARPGSRSMSACSLRRRTRSRRRSPPVDSAKSSSIA